MNDARDIAQYFYDETHSKMTATMFRRQMGTAKRLLETFTKEELMVAIDHCVKHPPRNGFTSLGWLDYAMNEINIKVQADAIRRAQGSVQPVTETVEPTEDVSVNNKNKFLNKQPKRFKGNVKF